MMPITSEGKHQFLDCLYRILREYQEGVIECNEVTIGKLDQPLTSVADAIQVELRKRVRSWRRNG
jgi:hypothetical protein